MLLSFSDLRIEHSPEQHQNNILGLSSRAAMTFLWKTFRETPLSAFSIMWLSPSKIWMKCCIRALFVFLHPQAQCFVHINTLILFHASQTWPTSWRDSSKLHQAVNRNGDMQRHVINAKCYFRFELHLYLRAFCLLMCFCISCMVQKRLQLNSGILHKELFIMLDWSS